VRWVAAESIEQQWWQCGFWEQQQEAKSVRRAKEWGEEQWFTHSIFDWFTWQYWHTSPFTGRIEGRWWWQFVVTVTDEKSILCVTSFK